MLPSRLFRNTGIPPALRSLLTPHPSLPSTLTVQLRFRLGVRPNSVRTYSSPTPAAVAQPASSSPSPSTTQAAAIAPRLSLTFTCTANACGERSTHSFSRQAYEEGIVLVQCPACHVRHLIADHIGWFKESTEDGSLRTVEDLLRARGEEVQRGSVTVRGDGEGGVVEYAPPPKAESSSS